MAGKSGGSWKVAYADFVTAMMAFFLVMWITAQDQKVKQSVARYFNNPLNLISIGTSTKPDSTGAIFEGISGGEVPLAQSVATGRGRSIYSPNIRNSPETQLVSRWLIEQDGVLQHWRKRAEATLKQAESAPEVKSRMCTRFQFATGQIASELQHEFQPARSSPQSSLHSQLLDDAMLDVNWIEIAEDILTD